MGFGFGLVFLFIILPLSGLLLLSGIISEKSIFLKLLGILWIGLITLILFVLLLQFFTNKKTIKARHIYGTYIIDRSKYSGPQADWQYNNYRFEITKNNELIFFRTNGKEILQADTISVEILSQYQNNRLRLDSEKNIHHILADNPTLYRQIWSFHYVFYSEKFGNVFFKKGKWRTIN